MNQSGMARKGIDPDADPEIKTSGTEQPDQAEGEADDAETGEASTEG
ncbi:hypothetical protein [Mycobacterium sp. ITM-2016-00318]|nr:hypothetical protein [Mycobacterium sp. ITM-2016-00318]WNG92862.1 hypothetical protein C6A82_026490 [Mycobacterium sp. ITM-2016-00318]